MPIPEVPDMVPAVPHALRTRPRPRALTALLAALLLAPLLALLPAQRAEAAAPAEDALLSMVNSARGSAGVAPLVEAPDLTAIARQWSSRMSASNVLSHNPDLRTQVTSWTAIAENVAYGTSIPSIHSALMGSSGHRANILNGTYTQVGIGVWTAPSGRIWVTEVFRRPAPGAAPLPAARPCAPATNPKATPDPLAGPGYWALARGGGLFTYGTRFFGAPSGTRLPVPAAAMAARPQGDGYWVVGPGGAVQDFGGARWHGDARGLPLGAPVVSIVPTSTGGGYWLVTADGGVFSYGDAPFRGSLGSIGVRSASPVVDAARTASGKGYFVVTANGAVFTFGDAAFKGTVNALKDPVTSIAVSPTGAGYWLLARDGGVFSFGVPYAGSIAGTGVCGVTDTATEIVPTRTGRGYWVLAERGGVFTFGDAPYRGAPGALPDVLVDLVPLG